MISEKCKACNKCIECITDKNYHKYVIEPLLHGESRDIDTLCHNAAVATSSELVEAFGSITPEMIDQLNKKLKTNDSDINFDDFMFKTFMNGRFGKGVDTDIVQSIKTFEVPMSGNLDVDMKKIMEIIKGEIKNEKK